MRPEVNEMTMLRWMCGRKKKCTFGNDRVRGALQVEPLANIVEKSQKWYGHIKEALYRMWCGVTRLGDSGVNRLGDRAYFSFC